MDNLLKRWCLLLHINRNNQNKMWFISRHVVNSCQVLKKSWWPFSVVVGVLLFVCMAFCMEFIAAVYTLYACCALWRNICTEMGYNQSPTQVCVSTYLTQVRCTCAIYIGFIHKANPWIFLNVIAPLLGHITHQNTVILLLVSCTLCCPFACDLRTFFLSLAINLLDLEGENLEREKM